jgi:hypothetical protein
MGPQEDRVDEDRAAGCPAAAEFRKRARRRYRIAAGQTACGTVRRNLSKGRLLILLVALLFMLFEHCPRGYLLGPAAIATRFFGLFLDVFVLAFFLIADASDMLLFRHCLLLSLNHGPESIRATPWGMARSITMVTKRSDYCPPSFYQVEDEHHERNHQQNVDESAQRVRTDHSEQPHYQQNYEDRPKHSGTPFLSRLEKHHLCSV